MALALPQHANAAVLFSGTIFDDPVTIGYHGFDVLTAGTIDIDVLSNDVLDGDAADNFSALNTVIRLFAFDAAGDLALLGAELASNDDGAAGSDGSVSSQDSFLSTALGLGSYVIAISDRAFSQAEARAGVDDGGSSFPGTFGDYEIRVSGDTRESGDSQGGDDVPEPTTMVLLGLGLAGLGFARRRRA